MSELGPHPRTDLGAYALGALEPADRRRVEQHLAACERCSSEVARLSALPGLLDRLTPEEALTDHDEVRGHLASVLQRTVAGEHGRLRRQVVLWRGSAAAALIGVVALAALLWAPWASPPDRLVAGVVPVAATADDVSGTVAAYAWEWGTTVEVRVADLPPATAYALWAIDDQGRRERAGTWGPTTAGGALVRGASAIPRSSLVRVEVTDDQGAALFAADFASSGG